VPSGTQGKKPISGYRSLCLGYNPEKVVDLRRAVRIRGGRWPTGTIRSATIRQDVDQWTLAVQFDGTVPTKAPKPELEALGIESDAGMGDVLRRLACKSAWRGRSFVKIDRFAPSSKTCSSCGHVHDGLAPGDRRWTCASCGEQHDRDVNASLNILRWGLTNLLRRGAPNVKPVERGALAARPTRKGKGLRRNAARRSGNMAEPQDLVSCGSTP